MHASLHMFGEAAAIFALAIIASISFNAWKLIAPDALVPVNFRRDGEPGMRMKKPLALLLMPVVATVILMMLALPPAAPGYGMVFTLILAVAIGFIAAHHVHIRAVLEVMEREGKLRS